MRKMPGRPSAKKRKKEAGEGEKGKVKRQKKPNKCGNCGELGHYKRTCKNKTVQKPEKAKGGRPPSSSTWAKEEKEKKQKRKATKEAYEKQIGTSRSATPLHPTSTAFTLSGEGSTTAPRGIP
ncbi:hypothetical protein RND81_13G006100 [Saponaria officinalis]|uniref:CCHC-type domain-containing protein n=1 Tax=Saponaria officinalis TaxID=3572 RepID=A0AAW1H132_SAPOF